MKRNYFYILIAILTFAVGTYFATNIFFPKINDKSELREKLSSSDTNSKPQIDSFSGEEINSISFDDLKINEIGLSSFQKDLEKKFGKPKKIRNNGNFYNCSDEDSKTLFFEGLTVDVTHISESKKYQINEIEISSSRFQLASGIKIGDDIESLFSKLGKAYHQTKDSDIDEYHFMVTNKNDVSNDGGVSTFSFRNNKLVLIHWHYNFC